MVPFYLVTGFLGSGKTTFLKNVLDKYSVSNRIVIIQNEFASSGIDGKKLAITAHPFKLVEINNGSVFCVCLLGTFIHTLEKLMEDYSPDMIFIEASGLADPVNIIELFQKESIRHRIQLAHIFCIVDALNFERGLKSLPGFRHQIMVADTIIINKTDLVEEKLSELHVPLKALNPFAEIIETSFSNADLDKYIFQKPANHKAAEELKGIETNGKPNINACVLKSHDRFTKDELFKSINELMKSSPRIKGFVNMKDGKITAIQTVFNHIEMKEIMGYSGPTEIIAFGESLTTAYLRTLFHNAAEA